MNKLLLLTVMFSANAFAKPVNINSADAQTISQSLTGISLKKAQDIVTDRTQKGDFKSLDDLKRVMGIGEKTIAVNKDDILFADDKVGKNNTGRQHLRTRARHGHSNERFKN